MQSEDIEAGEIEKAAIAMWNEHARQVDGGWLGLEAWEQKSADHKKHWMDLARVALTSLSDENARLRREVEEARDRLDEMMGSTEEGTDAVIARIMAMPDEVIMRVKPEDLREAEVALFKQTLESAKWKAQATASQATVEELTKALEAGIALEEGDLVGVEFKKAKHEFIKNARTALSLLNGSKSNGASDAE